MKRLRADRSIRRETRRQKRESFRSIIRRPAVQVLLTAAATIQVVAVSHGPTGARPGMMAHLAPVVVSPLMDRAASAERIAAEYREKGYDISPTLAAEIEEAAAEHGIEPEIAFGLVRAESSFRNVATSRVGAVGLTQLMPSTARWLEPGITTRALRDPETNLRVGFGYLRQLIDKYEGNVDLALVAYNRGPGTVDRALKRGGNPDNGYAAFVRGEEDHGHELFTR